MMGFAIWKFSSKKARMSLASAGFPNYFRPTCGLYLFETNIALFQASLAIPAMLPTFVNKKAGAGGGAATQRSLTHAESLTGTFTDGNGCRTPGSWKNFELRISISYLNLVD
jgi:hypothetical protein